MILKHIFYKAAAIFFMLFGLYNMLLDSLFISGQKFGPVLLCMAASALYVLISKIPMIRIIYLKAFEKINYHHRQIIVFFFGLETIKYIGYSSLSDYFLWLSLKITDPSAVDPDLYGSITAYLMFLALSAIIYIIALNEYKLISAVIFIFFILQWHFFIDSSYTNAVFYAAGFIMLHADSSLKEGGRYIENLGFSVFIPIAVFFLIMLSVIFPWKVSALELQRLSDEMTSRFPVLERLRDSVEDTVAGGEFELSDTPFQPDISRLGGSVELSDEIIMRVRADRPYYLRGTVKEEYTGSQWETVQEKIYLMEDNEFDIEPESIGYESETVTIYPDSLKTRTIFNPYFTYKVTGIEIELVYNDSLQIQRNRGDMNQQDPYTVEFFTPMLTSQRGYTEREMDDLRPYFSLPDTVTDRTRTLAAEITQDENGIYDKLSALEQYLRSGYPYSLSTSDLPEDADFVDHFLFTERKGYCTYYASAMGVMARSLGIATRYVEGFRMSDEKNAQGEYIIRKNRAHAWIEAYVPGSGWMTFEPTGSLTEQDFLASGVQPDQEDSSSDLPDDGIINENGPDTSGSPQEAEGSVYNEQGFESQENASVSISDILLILITAGSVVAASYYFYRKDRYKKMTSRDRVIFYYNKMAMLITHDDISADSSRNTKTETGSTENIYDSRTPGQKMDYLNEKYSLKGIGLGEYVERLLYSNHPVTDKDALFMQSLYERTKKLSKQKKHTE